MIDLTDQPELAQDRRGVEVDALAHKAILVEQEERHAPDLEGAPRWRDAAQLTLVGPSEPPVEKTSRIWNVWEWEWR